MYSVYYVRKWLLQNGNAVVADERDVELLAAVTCTCAYSA